MSMAFIVRNAVKGKYNNLQLCNKMHGSKRDDIHTQKLLILVERICLSQAFFKSKMTSALGKVD